jgi:hypothetical protein
MNGSVRVCFQHRWGIFKAMQRWAMRAAQWLSVLWATLFLSVSLLHPLTHNPLDSHHNNCLVCVLQKTPSPQPPALCEAIQSLATHWDDQLPPLAREVIAFSSDSVIQPLIPRAPPA